MLHAGELDPSNTPEQVRATLDLAVRYLHDIADARLEGSKLWTPETVLVAMRHEIDMLDYLLLFGEIEIATAVVEYHREHFPHDFPRPMGVRLAESEPEITDDGGPPDVGTHPGAIIREWE